MMLGESDDREGSVSGLASWRRMKMVGEFDEPWVRPRGKASESGEADDEMVEPSVMRRRVEGRCWERRVWSLSSSALIWLRVVLSFDRANGCGSIISRSGRDGGDSSSAVWLVVVERSSLACGSSPENALGPVVCCVINGEGHIRLDSNVN